MESTKNEPVTVYPITVYLGLGSNLGRRGENLTQCIQHLTGNAGTASGERRFEPGGLRLLRSSAVYETDPWGVTDQRPFLNCVLEMATLIPPQPLLDGIKGLEKDLGRQPGERYGPRLIDIDILLYGQEQVDSPDLQIPHSRLHERAFVLVPLAELAPGLIHPFLGLSIAGLTDKVEGKGGVRKWSGKA